VVLIGLAAALICALLTQLGFLLRHRGAVEAPDVDVRHPLATIAGLFRSRLWTLGYVVAAVAYAFHVGALALAPLSLVQAVLAGGLVLLAVLADRFFGFSLGKREWLGVMLASVGLAVLAISGGGKSSGESSDYSLPSLIAFVTVLAIAGTMLILRSRGADREGGGRCGIYLGIAAGLLFTVSHVAVKAVSEHAEGGWVAALVTPFPYLIVACGVVAFFASARSLQIGDGVAVIAVTSIAGNASSMPAGIVVFGDPLGSDPMTVTMRCAAFVLVIVAAALIPSATRAGERVRARGAKKGVGQAATV
jgi:drug/metabolite transporter (DMT)-like permease